MNNGIITGKGILYFDPDNKTNKHNKQASWKRTAMIISNDDTCAYYQWLIQRKYPFIQGVLGETNWINSPLRGTHVTVINDMVGRDFTEEGYQRAKEKYHKTEIYYFYSWEGLRNNGEHIYFKVESPMAMEVRNYAGLGDPYFGLHLTVGLVPEESYTKKQHMLNVTEYMDAKPYHHKNMNK